MLKRIRANYKKRVQENTSGPTDKKFFSLETLRNLKIAYIPYNELFREGLFAGLGWAIGVTIGFVIISTILVFILKLLGGLPFIGSFLASIIQTTQEQLLKRTPVIPQ